MTYLRSLHVKNCGIIHVFVSLCVLFSAAATVAETAEQALEALPNAKITKTFEGFPAYDGNVAFVSADGLSLIASRTKYPESEVFLWDIAQRKISKSSSIPTPEIADSGLSNNGRVLAIGSIMGKVFCWDLIGDKHIAIQPHDKFLTNIAIAPDGRKIVSVDLDKRILKETSLSAKEKHPSRIVHALDRTECSMLAYSPDGTLLAAGIFPGIVIVWDAMTLEKKWEQKTNSKPVRFCFTPDSRSLISTANDENIILWDAESGERQTFFQGNGVLWQRACVSPDGKWLATWGLTQETKKQTIVLWNMETKKGMLQHSLADDTLLRTPKQGNIQAGNLAFLPDSLGLVVFGKTPFLIGLKP